jgi:hypothetical protein
MKIEVKEYRPAKGSDLAKDKKFHDTRDLAGAMTFKATCDTDAIQLAALYRAWCLDGKKSPLVDFRANAIEEFLKARGMTINKEKP